MLVCAFAVYIYVKIMISLCYEIHYDKACLFAVTMQCCPFKENGYTFGGDKSDVEIFTSLNNIGSHK